MKTIYSDYMGTMIPAGFTIRKVLFDKQGKEPYKICKRSYHYTWDEIDLLYYWDEADDDMYTEIPKNGFRCPTLREDKTVRALVILD